jgi:alpha-glucosidase
MQMARATYSGLKKYAYPKRPFVITRSAYAGTQRYTSSWTGDNVATWEHLWIANVQAQRMAMSGFSFIGSDIGGFAEQPNGELFARWIQLGVFHPFCRTHSSGDHGEQEPWMFGTEITDIVRTFINLRYQLLPYLYTAFWHYLNDGTPILKSLVLFDQEDIQTHYRMDEFIYGEQILVCPILEPNARGRRVYLPKGKWYDHWAGKAILGGRELWVDADIDSIPMFVQEGAIIPKYPVQQYVGEKEIKVVTLEVYYMEGKAESKLYEDESDGYDYTKGMYSHRIFKLSGKEKDLLIQQHKSGKYITKCESFELRLIGLPFKVSKIVIDKEEVDLSRLDTKKNTLIIDKGFNEIHLMA